MRARRMDSQTMTHLMDSWLALIATKGHDDGRIEAHEITECDLPFTARSFRPFLKSDA
jgi:hypothetical protein